MISKVLVRIEEDDTLSQPLADNQLRQNLARARKQHREAKLLAVVNERPEGMTLVEAAESLDVVPVVLGRAVRNLQKRSKIHKSGKFYFPVVKG